MEICLDLNEGIQLEEKVRRLLLYMFSIKEIKDASDDQKVTNAAQQDDGNAEGVYYRLQKWAIANAEFEEGVKRIRLNLIEKSSYMRDGRVNLSRFAY